MEKKNIKKDPLWTNKKISFKNLFKMFKWNFLRHLISTIIVTLLGGFLFLTIENLIIVNFDGKESEINHSTHSNCNDHKHEKPNSLMSNDEKEDKFDKIKSFNGDYSLFFPRKEYFKKIFNQRSLNKNEFCLALSALFFVCSIIKYYDSKWENNIAVSSSSYIKNNLLNKFRSLEFEKKIEKKDEIKFLAESEADSVGSSWEHLFNHTFHSFLTIIYTLFLRFNNLKKINLYSFLFSIFWLIFINALNTLILKKLVEKELNHKDHLTKEIAFIDKETSKSLLVESMGLSSEYEKKQKDITKENDFFKKSINIYGSLNGSLLFLLSELYIPILFFVNNDPFSFLPGFLVFWNIYHEVGEILKCFREYPSYYSACSKINDFISLPDNDENIDKEKIISKNIKEIIFSNVDFKYSNGDKLILNKYNRVFSTSEINDLIGKNGTGKSTIIYLTLGMLKPLRGNVFIKLENEKILDLNKDVNIKDWKENVIAYCSHDNLIDEGSTGQRQIKNIKEVIKSKRKSKIFIFDEASNALDKSKQNFLSIQIEKLIKNKKIVIFVKH
ncbi:MAG: Vitamin B12 import ATP-binding protein BtuD [Mycoplasmataceae bacterium]|nr:MAG: Vitamin B12 import ATP-binding protein BtuD [Mycoplasmataceae bacterium]